MHLIAADMTDLMLSPSQQKTIQYEEKYRCAQCEAQTALEEGAGPSNATVCNTWSKSRFCLNRLAAHEGTWKGEPSAREEKKKHRIQETLNSLEAHIKGYPLMEKSVSEAKG